MNVWGSTTDEMIRLILCGMEMGWNSHTIKRKAGIILFVLYVYMYVSMYLSKPTVIPNHYNVISMMGTLTHTNIYIYIYIYRVSQEECARLREGVPYVKVYRYNPKHLCPKLNGYGDNGQRKVWSSGGSMHCTCQLTVLSMFVLECGVI